MITLYKRTNKTLDNPRGAKEILDGENPFLKPCLLCLSAQEKYDKSVFGIAKIGASLARVRVRNNYNAGFDIDETPINFLASRLSTREEDIKKFVDKYFVPLISRDGYKIDVNSACKAVRNINILTYCDGFEKASMMGEYLCSRMEELEYTPEEIEEIVRQIVVVPIATNLIKGTEKFSVLSFKDVYDDEVYSPSDDQFVESMDTERFVSYSPTVHSYYYKGDGKHDLKKYAFDDDVMKYVTYVIVNILENSVDSHRSHSVIPININDVFAKMKDLSSIKASKEDILFQLDKRVRYAGTPKLTKKEALLLNQTDVMMDRLRKAEANLSLAEDSNNRVNKMLLGLQAAIGQYCTDVNALRILLEGMGWQVSKEQLEQIMDTPSDREQLGEKPKQKLM